MALTIIEEQRFGEVKVEISVTVPDDSTEAIFYTAVLKTLIQRFTIDNPYPNHRAAAIAMINQCRDELDPR